MFNLSRTKILFHYICSSFGPCNILNRLINCRLHCSPKKKICQFSHAFFVDEFIALWKRCQKPSRMQTRSVVKISWIVLPKYFIFDLYNSAVPEPVLSQLCQLVQTVGYIMWGVMKQRETLPWCSLYVLLWFKTLRFLNDIHMWYFHFPFFVFSTIVTHAPIYPALC